MLIMTERDDVKSANDFIKAAGLSTACIVDEESYMPLMPCDAPPAPKAGS